VLAPFGKRFAAGERFRSATIRSVLADGSISFNDLWTRVQIAHSVRPP
jgi:hypothetical protein